ncbi:unnamed protein product [Albugo candida]|uniref:CCHC-type domain-containing protein n=1 Tax=Albugo candida TaxID=65357 RepID=A0A024GME0_9STRA|nr:unnamed protein product [Albugo candida]|eukprot:CCI47707.1 unnamed protein product [Albugo candida]
MEYGQNILERFIKLMNYTFRCKLVGISLISMNNYLSNACDPICKIIVNIQEMDLFQAEKMLHRCYQCSKFEHKKADCWKSVIYKIKYNEHVGNRMTLYFVDTDTGSDFSMMRAVFSTHQLYKLLNIGLLIAPSLKTTDHEEKIAYVAAGYRDDFLEGAKERQVDGNEMIQLMRGLMGRFDRLEESQNKILG